MLYRSSICVVALVGAFCITIAGASAWDDSKYPDFGGQWRPIGGPGRFARDQKAPLTPEYQAIFEADASEGGQSFHNKTYLCWSPGMPRVTNGYGEIEFIVTAKTFHILVDHIYDNRRIFTDGRPWPEHLTPTLLGTSIGQWVDEDGDGKYDVLVAERAVSVVLVPLTPPACRYTGTTRPSSRNAFTSISPIRTSPTTRSP
jgi:hypothetical protein